MSGPFRVMAAGCGGFVHHEVMPPSGCVSEPTVVGLVLVGRQGQRRAVWLGFACDAHAGRLVAPRALLPRDRDVLARRRSAQRVLLAGQRWAGEQEGPLARGADADRLVARALEWAEAHPR